MFAAQPRSELRVYFFLMKCFGFSDVNNCLIWSPVRWRSFLGTAAPAPTAAVRGQYVLGVHRCIRAFIPFFFLFCWRCPSWKPPSSSSRMNWSLCRPTLQMLSGASFLLFPLLGPLLPRFAPMFRWIALFCSFLREGTWGRIMKIKLVLHIREKEEAGLSFHRSGSL